MNMTIGKRITVGFTILIILLAVIAVLGYKTISDIAFLAGVVKDNTEKNMFIIQKEVDHLDWIQKLDLYMLAGGEFTCQLDHTKCGFGEWMYSKEVQEIDDKELSKLISQIDSPHMSLHSSAQKILNHKKAGNEEAAGKVYINETLPALKSTRDILNQIRGRYETIAVETAGNAAKDMEGNANRSRIIIAVVSIISLIIGLTMSFILSRQIVKQLQGIIKKLNESSEQVASASSQLSASSQQLAEGSSEQAASIEETSSTLEEASSMIKQNSENTKQAAVLAGQTKASADKGNTEMQDMMESMTEIKKSSDQIAKIIKVIDEIAFQTNILALNAAVEAARAGDAGMGFAVVAEEVRNLAQRSAQAAKDTAAIIESNIEMSEKGVGISKMVAESLGEITLQAKKVNELMDEIAAASQEQTQGIMQINKAIVQMEKVTQQNAANAEESATASQQLNGQAANMKNVVRELTKLVSKSCDENTKAEPAGGMKLGNETGTMTANRTTEGVHNPRLLSHRSNDTLKSRKTKEIRPEEVIPLEDDSKDF